MNKRIFIVGVLAACFSTTASAGFFGHIAEHAIGYGVGGMIAHEGDKALDSYESHRNQNNYSGQATSGGYNGGYHAGGQEGMAPASEALPNPQLTPGAFNPAVTQETLGETICRPGGYTRSIRPPESYTYRIKVKSIREYGYTDKRLSHYELDHLASLELGGSPDSPLNLWPEPHYVQGGWGSYAKDRLENKLHDMVCHGEISLRQAQQEEVTNWIEAYKKYIGPVPNNTKGW
jgi:hypothetical protein